MGLKFIGATDLASFMNALQAEQALPEEWAFANSGTDSSQVPPIGVYVHSLDRHFHRGRTSAGVPGPVGDHENKIRMPVLLGSVAFPDVIVGQQTVAKRSLPMMAGDPFRPGGQKIYATNTGPASEYQTIVDFLMELDGASAFPTVVPSNGPIQAGGGVGVFVDHTLPGGWQASNFFPTEFSHGKLVFEGLTDGILGETNLTGAGVYPKGLMLSRMRRATVPTPIGAGSSNAENEAVCWVDLDTGGVDGRMINTPGMAHSTEPNSEAPIAGKEFSWNSMQYVPDTDATFALPKGELIFYSDRHSIGVNPSFAQSIFLKVIDFNPLGVPATGGTPNRVHERVRFGPTTVDFDISPIFGIGGAGNNRSDQLHLSFHPPSRRFYQIQADSLFTLTTPGPAPGGESFIGYWLRTVDPVGVTSPVARDVPRTNDIIEYEAFIGGALGEPAAGIDVDWELVRNSTELEVIVPVFPGFNTIANPPIDGNFALDPEGTLLVFADSVLLVEGVDYTAILSLGRITWITDQTGATLVEATYEHRENDATPPHGTLLSASSQSEIDGRVFTQVLFPDDNDLVGTLDRLKVDLV